ncbi:hypothetical protein [Opitutus sp. ER46]|uniref:hypothetical protein n=1 Tax=Opitutus sp. ER46 TaxID=2161864 RepID=UPI0011B21980|nr:hypothetical protein [Opitutus sp. ER46]
MNQIIALRSVIVLLIVLLTPGCLGSSSSNRDRVIHHLAQPENRARLVRWVDENVRNRNWDLEKLDLGMDASPGRGAINVPIEWSIAGLKAHPGQEVRLIINAKHKVSAVYFGDPRLGVVVALNGDYGVDADLLHVIDSSVAVYSRD